MLDLNSAASAKRWHPKVRTGCITCRRRRIKCDESKNPGCNRCAKSSLVCEGYNTPKPWIFEPSPSTESDVQAVIGRHGHQREPAAYKIHFSPLSYAVGSTIAWRSSVIDYTFGRWLPADTTLALNENIPLGMWSVVADKAADAASQDVLTQSLMAMALVLMSIEGNSESLHGEAVHYYQRVLVQLRQKIKALNAKIPPERKETMVTPLLVSSFACALIEYALDSWEGTDSHLRGIEMLFTAHGPSILNDPGNRKMFFDHRIIWTCCSFIHRQGWMYSQPGWSDFSWASTDKVFNTPLQRLFTLVSGVPAIIEAFDKSKGAATRAELWAFYLQFSGHLAALENWKAYVVGTGQLPEPLVSHDGRDSVPNNFNFSSGETMMCHNYYSGLKVHVIMCVWEAIRCLRSATLAAGESELVSAAEEEQLIAALETEAMNICQSIRALLAESHGLLMTVVLIFIVDTAWTGFQALESWADRDISAMGDWYADMTRRWKAATGYHPLRRPWTIADKDARALVVLPPPGSRSPSPF